MNITKIEKEEMSSEIKRPNLEVGLKTDCFILEDY